MNHLFGIDQTNLIDVDGDGHFLHPDVIEPFVKLQRLVYEESGCDLQIISAHRSFERQMQIWNAKARGERAILDDKNEVIKIEGLTAMQVLEAIMRYSAIPGLSRHHWGSEIDVYDAAASKRSEIQLVNSEWEKGGPCWGLGQYLTVLEDKAQLQGFVRPYLQDRGGIAVEQWHLSYAPLSTKFQKMLDANMALAFLEKQDFELVGTILEDWDYLKTKYHILG